ncbi:MAG TPA: multidrug transporter subunit MdtD [Burkholderiaceae bacterium]|jgi:EmrB/QacA subfamily drug resistance transporter
MHELDDRTRRFLPWVVALAFFMQSLDLTVLNTALPGMARSLGEDPLRMQSAVIAYMLTVALLIPASGWLADRFGTRICFLWALGLFSAGSLACALSPSLHALVLSRILQGAGGALLLPVGRLAVLRAFPRNEFLPVMSFIAIPSLVGPLLGPTLGGFLVQYVSWHWIFLINLPVGAVAIVAAMRFMPQFSGVIRTAFDWIGFGLFSVGLMLCSIGLQGLGEHTINSALAILSVAAGLACTAAYWLHAARHARPLFDMALFSIPSYRIGLLGNLFARLGSGATPFLTPMFLQLGLGYSPSEAGLSMIPSVLGAMLTKTIATKLIQHLGYRRVLSANTLLLGGMIASFALVGHEVTHLQLAIQLGVFGVINSLQFTAMNALTLSELDARTASSGNTLLSVVMQFSMSLGVASSSLFLLLYAGAPVDRHVAGSIGVDLVPAFHLTYISIGAMAALAAFIFSQLQPREGRVDAEVSVLPED